MSSAVSRPSAANSKRAQAHFSALLEFQTDCWDTHHAISHHRQDFVLLDVRGDEAFKAGHLPNAVHLPHARIKQNLINAYPEETLFVVYCAGPHCNGADKAALNLSMLGRPVKKMIGGVTGWLDEGFSLTTNNETLKMKPNCEHCHQFLPPDATNAMICSHECTFCKQCVESVLNKVCPNCGGDFCPRPTRLKKLK